VKGRIAWGLAVFVLLVVALLTTSSAVYRLLYVFIGIPAFGYVGSVLSARRTHGQVRLLTPYLQVGEQIEQQLTVWSNHWWPKLLLEVRHRTSPIEHPGQVVNLWPYGRASWTIHTRADRRGVFTHGVLEVTSRDPLGLFARTVRVGQEGKALIYPATVELPGFYVPSGQGWSEGVVRGRTFTPSPIAGSIRDHVAGDSSAHIHWPSTLRMRKLMVKEYDREPSGPSDAIWIVLDLSQTAQAGVGTEGTVEYGVTIAASIAKRFLDAGRTVGVVVGGDKQTVVKAGAGPGQMGRVLHELALVQPGAALLSRGLATVAQEAAARAVVVIISPAPATEVAEAAAALINRGVAVVPVLLDAASFDGRAPGAGLAARLPGTNVDAYVIHKGDEIQRRLDHRMQVHSSVTPNIEQAVRR